MLLLLASRSLTEPVIHDAVHAVRQLVGGVVAPFLRSSAPGTGVEAGTATHATMVELAHTVAFRGASVSRSRFTELSRSEEGEKNKTTINPSILPCQVTNEHSFHLLIRFLSFSLSLSGSLHFSLIRSPATGAEPQLPRRGVLARHGDAPVISAWVLLEDVAPSMSPLEVWPGTHRCSEDPFTGPMYGGRSNSNNDEEKEEEEEEDDDDDDDDGEADGSGEGSGEDDDDEDDDDDGGGGGDGDGNNGLKARPSPFQPSPFRHGIPIVAPVGSIVLMDAR